MSFPQHREALNGFSLSLSGCSYYFGYLFFVVPCQLFVVAATIDVLIVPCIRTSRVVAHCMCCCFVYCRIVKWYTEDSVLTTSFLLAPLSFSCCNWSSSLFRNDPFALTYLVSNTCGLLSWVQLNWLVLHLFPFFNLLDLSLMSIASFLFIQIIISILRLIVSNEPFCRTRERVESPRFIVVSKYDSMELIVVDLFWIKRVLTYCYCLLLIMIELTINTTLLATTESFFATIEPFVVLIIESTTSGWLL